MSTEDPIKLSYGAFHQLEQALDMVIESLEVLSQNRRAEIEAVDTDEGITLLFQDVALLKDYRQPIEQVDAPDRIEDRPWAVPDKRPFHTQHLPEWRIQKSYTAKGSIFQFCISLSRGVIEEPSGLEYRT